MGKKKIIPGMKRKLTAGEKVRMRSDYLHTVFVEKGEAASWFITETEATGGYDGVVYGNTDLTKWTSEGLYQKPSKEEVVRYLKIAGIELKD